MPKYIDMTGLRIGKFIVLKYHSSDERGDSLWLCRCKCGSEKIFKGKYLRSHRPASCGCARVYPGPLRHGMTGTPLHCRWKAMLERCLNVNGPNFKNYGGRGICVCDRWLVFENFRDDMGADYAEGLTLDRIDNSKGYVPDNCRWTDRREQSRNRRKSSEWDFKVDPISTSTSGTRGAYWDKIKNYWFSVIRLDGKRVYLGSFRTKEEAGAAYQAACVWRKNGGHKAA